MKKNWTEMSRLEKAKVLFGVFVYLVGVATLYYATLIAAVTWVVDHTDTIKRLVGSTKNLVRTIRHTVTKYTTDDAFKEMADSRLGDAD